MRTRAKILMSLAAAAIVALACAGVYEHSGHQWATLKAVHVTSSGGNCTVALSVQGTCGYQVSRSGSRVVRIGLEGARAGNLLEMTHTYSGLLFQSYRITSATAADGSPQIQVLLETRSPARFSIQSGGPSLVLAMSPLHQIDALPVGGTAVADDFTLLPPMRLFPVSAAVAKRQTNLAGISIRSVTKDRTLVSLETTGAAVFTTLRLNNPPRLVIDLENTGISTGKDIYQAANPLVKEIRVAPRFDNGARVARVVADLNGDPAVSLHSGKFGVEVELTAPGLPGDSIQGAADEAVTRARREYEKKTMAMLMRPVKVTLNSGPPSEQLSGDMPASSVPRPAPRKVKPLLARRTKVEASQPLLAQTSLQFTDTLPVRQDWENVDSALAADTPAMLPTALAAMRAAQVVAGQGSTPMTMGKNPAHLESKTPSGYTGELISLNLKDVDLKDFFRLIHEISGLNVVVDSNVHGTVTLVLDDVPWDEALDIVLKNNGLGKQLEGNVLRIAKVSTLTAEEEDATKLQQAQELSAPLVEFYRPLKYAQAADTKSVTQVQGFTQNNIVPGVVSILKSFAPGSVLSTRGSVVADQRNNAVIVTDVPTQMPTIEAMIDKLDQKPKQISIEARIVQANADFTRQLSSVLAAAFNNRATGTAAGTGTNILSVAPTQPPLPALTPALQPLSVGNSGFGAFAITNASARYAISAALSAAETRDQAKIISRPTIVTQNNVPASVQQGVQIPIQTSINNTITVQFVNATLQLSVIPQVTQGGQIFLNIVVNNASVGAVLSFAGPSINTQEATTQVLVPDGGTVVFGGITVTNRNRSATYVPLLGSIPIIGNLFKSSQVNTNDQELLFFVSPKILPDNS
jgi:type IV pilus secretin PilQ/predicted competence protein